MDDRQAFKFGFMAHCIEQGLTTPAEMIGAVKEASATLEKQSGFGDFVGGAGKFLGGVGGSALSWGIPLALAAPPLIGAGIGSMAAKAQDVDDYDVDDAKNQEVIDTYSREAARLRRQGLVRRHGLNAPQRQSRAMF
jgi:hypothetical protein